MIVSVVMTIITILYDEDDGYHTEKTAFVDALWWFKQLLTAGHLHWGLDFWIEAL